MKRVGHLYDRIWDRENLLLAFHNAGKGKRASDAVRKFAAHLDANLCEIAESLRAERPGFGDYRRFTIRDPKERIICAAAFRERVIHHAIVNVCGPWLERPLIDDTYACRKGKGQYQALARARFFARKYPFFLKMDVAKYFDSIDHAVLMRMLGRLFKDERLLALFRSLLSSYETASGKGLPIGNLTSQYFANLYLSPFDHTVLEGWHGHPACNSVVGQAFLPDQKERGQPGMADLLGIDRQPCVCAVPVCASGQVGYVRYMDDMLVFGEQAPLKTLRKAGEGYLGNELKLRLKAGGFINRCGLGIEFLGYRVFADRLRLNKRSRRRFVRKLEWLDRALDSGEIGEDTYQARSTALFSFVQHADTLAFRKKILGRGQNRVEPAETGRQLEQRRAELSVGQPQQQQPVEPQQQQRVPAGCLSGSSTRLSDERSLNRSLSGSRAGNARLWDGMPSRPTGVLARGTKTAAAPGLVALANGPRAAFCAIVGQAFLPDQKNRVSQEWLTY